jgi:dephospho-CoA kinase
MKKIIGVTGTIGTGKSTVARMLKFLGRNDAVVLDADKIAHAFLKKNSDAAKIVASFFPEALDEHGLIIRDRLADCVFRNSKKLGMLNSIIHPFVIRAIRQKLEKLDKKFVITDVPMLIEANMLPVVDVLVLVNADKSQVIKRSRFSEKDLSRRLRKQMPFAGRKRQAIKTLGKDRVFIVNNSGDLKTTKKEVEKAWEKIR